MLGGHCPSSFFLWEGEQRVGIFPLSLIPDPSAQVALMTSLLVTIPLYLGHLRLELLLSSSPRKVTILDVVVDMAYIWVGTGWKGCT